MRDFAQPGRSPVFAEKAAIATSHPLATLAGLEVLRSGGNAVDAGLAAVAVQCVVDPLMTGIGGDCFALYTPAGAKAPIALNGSGRAPAAANDQWYVEQGITLTPTSPHVVTIPGAIAAWVKLSADHGRKPLGEVLQPAIRLAEEGFLIQQRVAFDWARATDRVSIDPDAKAVYLSNGKALQVGEKLRLPKLAATLRRIAAEGRAGFYEGPVAADMVGKLNRLGGLHTLQDFASATADYVTPISTRYRGYDVYECPPNGQGIGALMMLNALERFDLASLSPLDRTHLYAEICKQVYHHRDVFVGDPAHTTVPVAELLSAQWADRAAKFVDMGRAGPCTLFLDKEHKDTVYISVVDDEGNALSLINSVFESFGSGILAPESGVLLHNRGYSFRIEPGHPNSIRGGKRPMHTIIPGMLMKGGKTVAPFGVMGGQYQSMGHVQLLTGIIDLGLNVQEALDAPRSFARDATLEIETTVPADVAAGLTARGHAVTLLDAPLGGGQIIWIDEATGRLAAGSDPRKDGCAMGY